MSSSPGYSGGSGPKREEPGASPMASSLWEKGDGRRPVRGDAVKDGRRGSLTGGEVMFGD